MLFNSWEFIFLFLPVTLTGFFLIARRSHPLAALWLAAASLFFYGWWNPKFVSLLLASIAFNYGMGQAIARREDRRSQLLVFAVSANLLLLGVFKYANFFMSSLNGAAGTHFGLADIVLPLGISFFTFTQIAFLVDVSRGIVREYNFVHYLLFVTYFPHLIAGPVLHHKQMMPQFSAPATYRISPENLAAGLAMFSLGLGKKVLLADTFADYASPLFVAVGGGAQPDIIAAWLGAVAYTFQLYFDFSGYSDMAIGLSLLFGVRLPLNFNSPYKAWNIIEFWRRWHMTLSQFLRDYLYIPLGGNRSGPLRRHANLMATMLLGGLWHGANWTFVIWGGLHGAFLVINHAWRGLLGRCGIAAASRPTLPARMAGTALTFLAVVVAWVFFRAQTFADAGVIVQGMLGIHGMAVPSSLVPMLGTLPGLPHLRPEGLFAGVPALMNTDPLRMAWQLSLGAVVIFLLPNSQELVLKSPRLLQGRNALVSGSLAGVLFALVLINLSRVSEFLYFQF